MPHDNVALVRRWFEEVWNQRRAQTIDELITPESVCYLDDGPMRGPEEFKARQYDPFVAAFPDLRVEVEATIAQGDQVVVRWSAVGSHTGDGLGFRATHERVTFRGMSWIRVQDGKMMEGWQSSNIPEVVRGLLAASAASA
jgi:predicted ester cyclase